MKKKLIGLGIIGGLLTGGGMTMSKSYLTKDYIVEKIEKSINSRVQIGELNVGFLGGVELKDVIIAERDEVVEQKVLHDAREPIDGGPLQLGSVSVQLSLSEIISRKISLEAINIDKVKAEVHLLEDGSCNVEELFDKPEKERKKKKKAKKKKTFNAKKNEKFVTEIKELNITNLDVNLLVEKTQMLVEGKGVYLKVTGINVNPKQLETLNDADISLGGTFDVSSKQTGDAYGHIGLSGETALTLFNTESGDLETDMQIDLVLSPDSYLTTKLPVISKVWKSIWKSLDKLEKIGVKKVRLPERAEFRDNQKIKIAYKLGKIDLLETFSVHLDDWELQAVGDSHLNTGSDEHVAEMKLYVGNKASSKVTEFLNQSKRVGELLGKLGGSGQGGQSWVENGRIVLAIGSQGLLSDPQIQIRNDLAAPLKKGIESLFDKGNRDKLKQGKKLFKELKSIF